MNDRHRIEVHLLRLDATDRHMRFCNSVGDQAIRAYCNRINWSHSTALGCFVDGELRGMAELMLAPYGIAEFALTVEKPFQDQGIGTRLLHKMLVVARNRCITSLYMICLLENRKMQHLARKLGANLVIQEGQVEGRIWPPRPTYLSYVEEATLDGQAWFRAGLGSGLPAMAEDPIASLKSGGAQGKAV